MFIMPMGIFIMPTEEELPPRALLLPAMGNPIAIRHEGGEWKVETEDGWFPVESELGESITKRALELGVELEGA